jgi:hypothetical protein
MPAATLWSWCPLRVSLVVQRLELLQQRPIEVVIAPHHQLRVDGAVLVGGIGVGAHRSGCLLPLLEQCLGDLALQLVCGLLPGPTSAIAHLNGVLARALDLGFLGVDGSGEQDNARGDQQVLHPGLLALPEGYGVSLALATTAAPRVSMDPLTSPLLRD